jgi:hypothetical protein
VKPKRPYASLQDYMERTSTNGAELLKMVKEETGHIISPTMLSFILRGSRRCSRFNAFAIHLTTGIPMDVLTQSGPSRKAPTVRRASKKTRGIVRENENVA